MSFKHACICRFYQAQRSYNEGKFQLAYNEFYTLAKLGNSKSQYNLAVMLSKGEGIEQNLIEAYAWAKISEEKNNKYAALTEFIVNNLSANDLTTAKSLYQNYYDSYAYKNSKVILGPIVEINKNMQSSKQGYKLVADFRLPPKYPRAMLINKVQGWVQLSFFVYPDGSVRDIQVVEELPVRAFVEETIKIIEKYRYHYEKNGERVEIKEPIAATFKLTFSLAADVSPLTQKQGQYIKKLFKRQTQEMKMRNFNML